MKTIQKKICLRGDFSVGKSSLVRQFVEGQFDDSYLSTIGVKISRKPVELSEKEVALNLLIWDLAGGDDYSKVTSGYLAGAAGVVMVCDITRKNTLLMLEVYSKQLTKVLKKEIPIVILANKCDLIENREIDDAQLDKISEKISAPWHFSSAKTGEGVETGFRTLSNLIL